MRRITIVILAAVLLAVTVLIVYHRTNTINPQPNEAISENRAGKILVGTNASYENLTNYEKKLLETTAGNVGEEPCNLKYYDENVVVKECSLFYGTGMIFVDRRSGAVINQASRNPSFEVGEFTMHGFNYESERFLIYIDIDAAERIIYYKAGNLKPGLLDGSVLSKAETYDSYGGTPQQGGISPDGKLENDILTMSVFKRQNGTSIKTSIRTFDLKDVH